MAGVPEAVTITGIVISAIAATNAIMQTAIRINEIYGKEGKRTIEKLRCNNLAESCDTCKTQNVYIDEHCFQMCNPPEKALILSIQSAFKYSNDVDKHAVIDVSVVLNILNGEHDVCGTHKVSCMCISSSTNTEENSSIAMDFVYSMREISSKLTKGGYKAVATVTSKLTDERDGTQSSDELLALLALLGETVCKVADSNFDGKLIKIGFGEPTNRYNDTRIINLLVETDWTTRESMLSDVRRGVEETIALIKNHPEKAKKKIAEVAQGDGMRNIILIGESGSGKSYTGNQIIRMLHPGADEYTRWFEESSCGACTSRVVRMVCGSIGEYSVWDTPGLMDGYGRDELFINKITDAMYEIGQISLVVLCIRSLERSTLNEDAMISKYSRIIGPAMKKRIVVVVNRQSPTLADTQVNRLADTYSEKGIILSKEDIIYNNNDCPGRLEKYLEEETAKLRSLVFVKCAEDALRIGAYEAIYTLLNKILKSDGEDTKDTEEKLIQLSVDALREEITRDGRTEPRISWISEHKVVLSRYNDHSFKYNRPCSRRWSLKTVKTKNVFSRLKATLGSQIKFLTTSKDLNAALQIIRDRKLVFLKRGEDVTENVSGDDRLYITQRYALLSVEGGINENTIAMLRGVLKNEAHGLDLYDGN